MRGKSVLAVISVAAAFGMASPGSAEAGWCAFGWCGPQPVQRFVYYPQYNNYFYVATFGPDPYPHPYVYVPRGYWPRYERPYRRYGRRFWRRRNARYFYAVPPPMPVPVEGCCEGRYLK